MKKLLQRWKRDCRGAVTVFVTLMLVPAVLISGTGVDLARLYVARSEIQDANQLAANATLASYDALLQDLYGLFGVMQTDGELAEMMEEYIRLALFGEDWNDRSMGTFSHFYGDASSLAVTAKAADEKNLENTEVLRRQIEEYVKFRAPAIIVNEVLDKLDTFEKIKEDAKVIKAKMDVDDKVDEIEKEYEKLYECIENVNQAKSTEAGAVSSVNSFIDRMRETVFNLFGTREGYSNMTRDENDDGAEDYENKYKGLFDNLHAFVAGGTIKTGYILGNEDDNGNYHKGYFTGSYHTDGVEKSIRDKKSELEKFISNSSFSNDSLKELVDLAEKAEKKRKELSDLLDNLENELNAGKCSSELKTGLTEQKNNNGKTYIENYRELLAYDIVPMAQAMQNYDEPQLNRTITMLENDVGYGNPNLGNEGFFSFTTLGKLNENQDGYEIDLEIQNDERHKNDQSLLDDKLARLNGLAPKKFQVPGDGFEVFQSSRFSGTHNKEFYEKLQEMFANQDKTAKKKNIIKGLEKAAGKIQKQFTGMLEFEPLGAWNYSPGAAANDGDTGFGSDGDWSGSGSAKSQAKKALNDSFLSQIADAGSRAADKLLLLTYDSEMFSCYATNEGYSGDEANEPTEENMAGIPLGIKVNYYFQSELEYLYNGNLNDARANLKAVTGMIYLVRFVMDYTASFVVPSVNKTVADVEAAVSFLGPGAVAIGELVRLVMALGEGVSDVSRLKDGCTVTVITKTDQNWHFSPEGIFDQIADGVVGEISDGDFGAKDNDKVGGFTYKDYLRLFLLLKSGSTLAQRTAELIELNVTNYKEKIGENSDRSARESAMAAAERVDLRKAITDFSVTTTVDLKMLFLSMPVAQKGVNGVVPPGTKELVVTDYRGY
ncbi:DUF5702 domain-containing protein [Colidextribacter sp. 210702-DFI.3.9]|nr:DUF5702 domain-containing protein [Colidextribacter sp. 210702-DFI.3.9]MCG4469222.1 DUF5702 domain-containing protein [Lawsonibacter sp. DFI.6.74]MCG4772894.1 DUF5702 domain-containing protein [Lawsonibacter sp. DFI.5.51]